MFKKIITSLKRFASNIRLYVFFTLLIMFNICNADFFVDYGHQANHFSAGFTIGTITTKVLQEMFYVSEIQIMSDSYIEGRATYKRYRNKDFWYYAVPMAVVVLAGVWKESRDSYFDYEQLGWTCIGGGCAITLVSW